MKTNDVRIYKIQIHGPVEEEDINLNSPQQLKIEQVGETSTTVTIRTDQSGIIGLIRHLHSLGLVLLSVSYGNENHPDTRFKISSSPSETRKGNIMKNQSVLNWLILGIGILALIAAGLGVFWQGEGQESEFLTLRGETVTIQGHGLYQYDTVSIAAQAIAQDVVTLLVGIPLLVISMILFKKGSLQGKLLLSGTLAYFLYTYASYAFLVAYNSLFLVYVSLFSLSLFALIFALMEIDIPTLPMHFSSGLPRRTIAIFFFIVGGFLLFEWLGRIVPAFLANQPPPGLESYTTLIIQALDLGLVIPIAFLSGILLWKKSAWGYLLSSIVLIKLATLALAVSAMAVNVILAGMPAGIGELIMFPSIAIISGGMTIVLLRNDNELRDRKLRSKTYKAGGSM